MPISDRVKSVFMLARRGYAAENKIFDTSATPTAADILYKNPEAIANRLKLFHYYRLQAQLKLDIPLLKDMRKPWSLESKKDAFLRISFRNSDNHPGIESQYTPEDGTIYVSVLIDQLKLTKQEEELLFKLAKDKIDFDRRLLKFHVNHFPFKEINERRAREIVKDLLSYIKNDQNDRFQDIPRASTKGRRRSELEFPADWLPSAISSN